MPLGRKVGLDPSDNVLDADPAPLLKRGYSPPSIFGPYLLYPNGWMDQDATWYGGRLDGDPAVPPPKRGLSPKFSAHVCCGQTVAGWTNMPLDTIVGLGLGNIVLDADPAPPPRGTASPISAHVLWWPNGSMDQDLTWYETRPRPMPHCVRLHGDPAPLPIGAQPPIFGPCLLWPNGRPSQLLLGTYGNILKGVFVAFCANCSNSSKLTH